jgi:hypothetical protein
MNKLRGPFFIIFLLCFFGAATWPEKGMQLIGEGKKTIEFGRPNFHELKEVNWEIKILSKEPPEIEVSINSTRGGVERKRLQVK